VVKVVRELGQPALAHAFAQQAGGQAAHASATVPHATKPAEIVVCASPHTSLPTFLGTCRREYGLHALYTRDLRAAHADGLLTLTGLEWPHELAACVLAPVRLEENGQIRGLIEALGHARSAAGGLVALDSPEFALARTATSDAQVAEAVQDF